MGTNIGLAELALVYDLGTFGCSRFLLKRKSGRVPLVEKTQLNDGSVSGDTEGKITSFLALPEIERTFRLELEFPTEENSSIPEQEESNMSTGPDALLFRILRMNFPRT